MRSGLIVAISFFLLLTSCSQGGGQGTSGSSNLEETAQEAHEAMAEPDENRLSRVRGEITDSATITDVEVTTTIIPASKIDGLNEKPSPDTQAVLKGYSKERKEVFSMPFDVNYVSSGNDVMEVVPWKPNLRGDYKSFSVEFPNSSTLETLEIELSGKKVWDYTRSEQSPIVTLDGDQNIAWSVTDTDEGEAPKTHFYVMSADGIVIERIGGSGDGTTSTNNTETITQPEQSTGEFAIDNFDIPERSDDMTLLLFAYDGLNYSHTSQKLGK